MIVCRNSILRPINALFSSSFNSCIMKYNHSHVIVFQLFSTAYAYGPHLCYLNENRNSYRTTSHHKNDKDGSSDQRCS